VRASCSWCGRTPLAGSRNGGGSSGCRVGGRRVQLQVGARIGADDPALAVFVTAMSRVSVICVCLRQSSGPCSVQPAGSSHTCGACVLQIFDSSNTSSLLWHMLHVTMPTSHVHCPPCVGPYLIHPTLVAPTSWHNTVPCAVYTGTTPPWLHRLASAWSALLAHPVVNLPVGATVVGLICAAVGPVRQLLVNELAPLHWLWLGLGWVGAAAAPIATMQIGKAKERLVVFFFWGPGRGVGGGGGGGGRRCGAHCYNADR
jgi:hypothetical protein